MTKDIPEKEPKYKGWTNQATWGVYRWHHRNCQITVPYIVEIEQDLTKSSIQEKRQELIERLKRLIERHNPTPGCSLQQELLKYAISKVNWEEIAENLLPD